MKRPFANRGFDSASRASKTCVRHGCVNQRPIRKEAIPYGWRELRRDSRFEEFDGSFCIALQRATIIPRILERERHALVGSRYALAGNRNVTACSRNATAGSGYTQRNTRAAIGRCAQCGARASIGRRTTTDRVISIERAASAVRPALIDKSISAGKGISAGRAAWLEECISIGRHAMVNGHTPTSQNALASGVALSQGCISTGGINLIKGYPLANQGTLAGDGRSATRRTSIDACTKVTTSDNAVPDAQSTLLSEHNSHGGLFLRRFRNAPDAASATTTFLRWRRLPK